MSSKLFTEDEILELRSSPYVVHVSSRSVTFTPEFKQKAYDELCGGKSMRRILEEHGIDTAALGASRIRGLQEKIEIASRREEGFAPIKRRKRSESGSGSGIEIEDKSQRRIRQLEHELAYTKQEVEFLKKTQQADMEARKQWESRQRRKRSTN